jgi:hypothetical protein
VIAPFTPNPHFAFSYDLSCPSSMTHHIVIQCVMVSLPSIEINVLISLQNFDVLRILSCPSNLNWIFVFLCVVIPLRHIEFGTFAAIRVELRVLPAGLSELCVIVSLLRTDIGTSSFRLDFFLSRYIGLRMLIASMYSAACVSFLVPSIPVPTLSSVSCFAHSL